MTTEQNYLDKHIPDNKELWFILKIIGIINFSQFVRAIF